VKAGAVDLVVGRGCKIFRSVNVKISEMTFFRGLLPVSNKSSTSKKMLDFLSDTQVIIIVKENRK